ncbi:MAG: glycosyltransferase family 4 protein [Thermodesulfobacteriota bacterium]
MKIGLSVQGMIGQRVDGGRRYTIELLRVLVPFVYKLGHEVIIFCSEGDNQIINKMKLDCRIIPICGPLDGNLIFRSVRWGLRKLNLWSHKNLEWYAKKTKVDFIHFFGFPDYSYTGPCIVTLHCLQHEYFPEFFENVVERSNDYKKMLRRANIILTNSHYTAKSIHECCNGEFDDETIIPTPLGGGKNVSISGLNWHEYEKKYQIKSPYLIYPASNLKNKNHTRLLEALCNLIHKEKININLVLTGFNNFPKLHWDIERLGLGEHVLVLGKVPDEDLRMLIENSLCMSFVSLFEGFGLPIVESMAIGTPVVCSQVASIPEVGGDAVLYCDPLSVDDITEKLKRIIQDDALRTELITRGKTRAAEFTWEKCASDTYRAYEKLENILFRTKCN